VLVGDVELVKGGQHRTAEWRRSDGSDEIDRHGPGLAEVFQELLLKPGFFEEDRKLRAVGALAVCDRASANEVIERGSQVMQGIADEERQSSIRQAVYKLKDDTGVRLTDHRLLERLAETFPWINTVYRDASAFVHLSARHLWTSISAIEEAERLVVFQISPCDPARVTEDQYYDAVDAFYHCLLLAKGLILSGMRQVANLGNGSAE